MRKSELLLQRLAAIGLALSQRQHTLALLGLGSVGEEIHRLDDYSDLDFFAIVEPGHKMRFVEHLDWLEQAGQIAYCFRNSFDGYKLMYADGVFCEFAVFEPQELQSIPFSPGRIVWQQPWFDSHCCQPQKAVAPAPSTEIPWLVGEAITNLYVGLCRYHRGEKLSALTFIQQYAFQRVLDLNTLRDQAKAGDQDIFARDRRYEQQHPDMVPQLANMLTGYADIPAAAAAIMSYLETHFEVNAAMKTEVHKLILRPIQAS